LGCSVSLAAFLPVPHNTRFFKKILRLLINASSSGTANVSSYMFKELPRKLRQHIYLLKMLEKYVLQDVQSYLLSSTTNGREEMFELHRHKNENKKRIY
jgi:hypothetical protein